MQKTIKAIDDAFAKYESSLFRFNTGLVGKYSGQVLQLVKMIFKVYMPNSPCKQHFLMSLQDMFACRTMEMEHCVEALYSRKRSTNTVDPFERTIEYFTDELLICEKFHSTTFTEMGSVQMISSLITSVSRLVECLINLAEGDEWTSGLTSIINKVNSICRLKEQGSVDSVVEMEKTWDKSRHTNYHSILTARPTGPYIVSQWNIRDMSSALEDSSQAYKLISETHKKLPEPHDSLQPLPVKYVTFAGPLRVYIEEKSFLQERLDFTTKHLPLNENDRLRLSHFSQINLTFFFRQITPIVRGTLLFTTMERKSVPWSIYAKSIWSYFKKKEVEEHWFSDHFGLMRYLNDLLVGPHDSVVMRLMLSQTMSYQVNSVQALVLMTVNNLHISIPDYNPVVGTTLSAF